MDWQEFTKTHFNYLEKYFSCLELVIQMLACILTLGLC